MPISRPWKIAGATTAIIGLGVAGAAVSGADPIDLQDQADGVELQSSVDTGGSLDDSADSPDDGGDDSTGSPDDGGDEDGDGGDDSTDSPDSPDDGGDDSTDSPDESSVAQPIVAEPDFTG